MQKLCLPEMTSFPEGFLECAKKLYDHQLWVIGRDIQHPEGNLLKKYGFEHLLSPDPARGTMTQYQIELKHDWLYLWGFGAYIGTGREGLFLPRRDFIPRLAVGEIRLHNRETWSFPEASDRKDLLLTLMTWFMTYENWIKHNTTETFRRERSTSFPRLEYPWDGLADLWAGHIHTLIREWNILEVLQCLQTSEPNLSIS